MTQELPEQVKRWTTKRIVSKGLLKNEVSYFCGFEAEKRTQIRHVISGPSLSPRSTHDLVKSNQSNASSPSQ